MTPTLKDIHATLADLLRNLREEDPSKLTKGQLVDKVVTARIYVNAVFDALSEIIKTDSRPWR